MPDRRVVFLLVLIAAACAKKEAAPVPPPSAAPSPTATAASAPSPISDTSSATSSAAVPAATPAAGAIATADGEESGVTVAIKELKRTSGGIVSIKFVITNGSSKKLGFGYAFADPEHEVPDFSSVGGVQLLDPVGKKKYFVARDSEGKCVCSRGVKDVAAGASVNLWAKFPAPPDDVQKVSIVLPHFSPMDDVPISR